ncbi:MAG: hypothetical protein DMF80_18675 [Acidobacteria bacterium]|nr:MAG: hypothetical protein DMF80_18675 [Acidobacteriota bacterium]PYQ24721.1 MAG: hypothetical protein DMF81_04695 [Acidobacteriota bacterium]
MRVLLDECLPRKLKAELSGHETRTVPEAGWAGKKNSELLDLAAGLFDVFLTVDAAISLHRRPPSRLAVIILKAPSNRLEVLRPLMPRVRELIRRLKPGRVTRVGP